MFDVTGAGDTVIATLAVMLAAGAGLEAAMRIANRAAGIVVGKLGTAAASARGAVPQKMTYYIVTGAAGFIGSKLVEGAQPRAASADIDRGRQPRARRQVPQPRRLRDRRLRRQGRLHRQPASGFEGAVEAVLHQGACSDTMETDGRYMMENNYDYSKRAARLVPGRGGAADLRLVGLGVRRRAASSARSASTRSRSTSTATRSSCSTRWCAGGCRDSNCADRRLALLQRLRPERGAQGPHGLGRATTSSTSSSSGGRVRLFDGTDGYGNGEQRRDFVYVDDVVDVNLWFLEHREVSGIFNCGTGRAQSFNEVAAATINADAGHARSRVKELAQKGLIEYIPFPPALVGKYQSFTQADLARLRAAGYAGEFRPVEQGVAAYVARAARKAMKHDASKTSSATRRWCACSACRAADQERPSRQARGQQSRRAR